MYHINGVWENPNVKVFDEPRHLTDQKHVNYFHWTRTRVAQFILCITLLMFKATIQHLNNRRQESKQESKNLNLQFRFLTHLWPWHKVKFIKPTTKMYVLSKVIIMQSLKDLAITVSEKKATLKVFCLFVSFSSVKICQLSPWTCVKIKIVVYSWCTWRNQ